MNDPDSPRNKFIFDDIKSLINLDYYKFLLILFENIFLKPNNKTTKSLDSAKQLKLWIEKINEKFYKKDEKGKLSIDYTLSNLKNILNFAKKQNKLYAAEIIENILIIVFSFAFKTRKENTFGKYLYNNIQRLKDKKSDEFSKWFVLDKFSQDRFYEFRSENDIKDMLKYDVYIENVNEERSKFQKGSVLINFLLELHKEKYCNKKYRTSKNFICYINREKIDFDFSSTRNRNRDLDDTKTCLDRDTSSYFNYTIYGDNFFEEEKKKFPIGIVKAFFISVYIYYQNKYSPLMKYINKSPNEEKELAIIPFEYDLTGAVIESQLAGIIMAPSRIEPRISKLNMVQNILKEKGLLELAKALLFNNNIKVIDFHQSAVKSNQIESFNNSLGLFDNNSVEELILLYNYIKDDCDEYLSKILSHLKGLKTINLSSNDVKNGIAPFFVTLKNLYRKKKINLENLILNKCFLDDVAFYELGELLESKYCKLKTIYLNMDCIPSNVDFLKRLKKNRSLTEIFLNKSNIGDDKSDTIMRIISNSNIEYLCLYRNHFNDFEECLKILYRTKFISKEKGNNIIREDSSLYNIDLSNNDYLCINKEQLELLVKILQESTLYCIDVSHILLGNDPNKTLNTADKTKRTKYQNRVIDLKNNLEEGKKDFIKIIEEIHSREIDYKKMDELERQEKFQISEKIKKEISDIIEDKNSNFPIFLRESAKKIILENRDLFDKDKTLNNKELKEKEINLAKYIELKKSLEILEKLKEKKRKKKLIII